MPSVVDLSSNRLLAAAAKKKKRKADEGVVRRKERTEDGGWRQKGRYSCSSVVVTLGWWPVHCASGLPGARGEPAVLVLSGGRGWAWWAWARAWALTLDGRQHKGTLNGTLGVPGRSRPLAHSSSHRH